MLHGNAFHILYYGVCVLMSTGFYSIGRVEDVLFVVYTERGSSIRMISARYATKREEEVYYGNC